MCGMNLHSKCDQTYHRGHKLFDVNIQCYHSMFFFFFFVIIVLISIMIFAIMFCVIYV